MVPSQLNNLGVYQSRVDIIYMCVCIVCVCPCCLYPHFSCCSLSMFHSWKKVICSAAEFCTSLSFSSKSSFLNLRRVAITGSGASRAFQCLPSGQSPSHFSLLSWLHRAVPILTPSTTLQRVTLRTSDFSNMLRPSTIC